MMNTQDKCELVADWCTDMLVQPEFNREFRDKHIGKYLKEIHGQPAS